MKKANPLFSLLPIAYFALASLGCTKTDSLGTAGSGGKTGGSGGATSAGGSGGTATGGAGGSGGTATGAAGGTGFGGVGGIASGGAGATPFAGSGGASGTGGMKTGGSVGAGGTVTGGAGGTGSGGSGGTGTGGAGADHDEPVDAEAGPDAQLADASPPDLASPDVHGADEVAVDVATNADRFAAIDLANSEIPIRDGVVPETNPALCRYRTASPLYPAPAFTFSVTLPNGKTQSCSMTLTTDGGAAMPYWPAPITSEISGRVTAVSGTDLSVDTCEAGSGCSPNVYRFSVQAPGLTLTVPMGRRVSVWWWLYNGGWSCGQMLAVSDGVSMDAGTGTAAPLWLAGSDSVINRPLPAPFSVARQELFCNPSPSIAQGCGGNDVPPDDYAFQFTPQSGDPPLVLATGETGTLALTAGSGVLQHLTIHNLRSYQTSGCDDYWNWAWWAIGHAGTDGEPQ